MARIRQSDPERSVQTPNCSRPHRCRRPHRPRLKRKKVPLPARIRPQICNQYLRLVLDRDKFDDNVVGPVGFEPTTFGLKVRCSAELSYRPAHPLDSNAAHTRHSSNSSPSSAKADAVDPVHLSGRPSSTTDARNLIPSAFKTRSTVENSGFPSGDSDL